MTCQGSASAGAQQPCSVRTSHCAARQGFPRISAVQRRCAARICRTRSARLLAALKAATAPSFVMAQGLVYATGTRALPPRDPGFTSFPGKRCEIRKAAAINRNPQETSIKTITVLRHKPSKRQFFCGMALEFSLRFFDGSKG